jgi:hypothetical protein
VVGEKKSNACIWLIGDDGVGTSRVESPHFNIASVSREDRVFSIVNPVMGYR